MPRIIKSARIRHAGAATCLILALVLLVSGLAPLLQTPADPLATTPAGSTVDAKGRDQRRGNPDRREGDVGRHAEQPRGVVGEDHERLFWYTHA